MSGDDRLQIMAMIKVFSEQLFRKVSAIQTRENRPLDCFAEQSLKKSKIKIHALRCGLTNLPTHAGRQALWSPQKRGGDYQVRATSLTVNRT